MRKRQTRYLLALGLLLSGVSALGAPTKAPPKSPAKPPARKPAPNQVKGQAQLEGANGRFGTVYTLQGGFNFAILSARYSLEPFIWLFTSVVGTDQKLLVMDIAIKNARPEDNFFGTDDLFTAVDATGQLHPGSAFALRSRRSGITDLTLRPGQGLGQSELKDPLQVAFSLPAKARIVKVMVNRGRAARRDEKVLRYYIAGATKAEAGEAGDSKNVIAPLPDTARDPSDPSGAVALDEGKGSAGIYAPTGAFAVRLDGFAYSEEALVDGSAPEEGNRWAVATITVKCLTDTADLWSVAGGALHEITDADGERAQPAALRKARRDEAPDAELKRGEESTFRVIFTLPRDTTARKLVLGAEGSRKWAFDVSATK